mgnify:CR=1 FL=1
MTGTAYQTVFVSSEAFTGNFGSAAAADAACDNLASAAGVDGIFKAILATETTDILGQISITGNVFDVNGNFYLDSAADLTDLSTPLGYNAGVSDEYGDPIRVGEGVWTGSDGTGAKVVCGSAERSRGARACRVASRGVQRPGQHAHAPRARAPRGRGDARRWQHPPGRRGDPRHRAQSPRLGRLRAGASGGAAGGGKSDALIIDACGLQQNALKYNNYRERLFRRSFPELRELIDRSRAI